MVTDAPTKATPLNKKRKSWVALLFQFICLLYCAPSHAQAQDILPQIVYPLLTPPYGDVVETTVVGVESALSKSWRKPYSGSKPDATGSAIILTNKTRGEIEGNVPSILRTSVVGLAELSLDLRLYGVSMFIDPSLYVENSLRLSDEINEIIFFYDKRRSTSPDLNKLTSDYNVTVRAHGADSVGEALAAVADENRNANNKKSFVFTRGFIEIDQTTLLDFIVRQTWNSKVVTVTNKASYVKAGLTLGVVPDFRGYGQQIGKLYLEAEKQDFYQPKVEYLKHVVEGINVRTAQRSGILTSPSILSRYKFSYPSR